MKKFLLTSAVTLALTGCGGSGSNTSEEQPPITTPPVVVVPTPQEVFSSIAAQFDSSNYQFARFDIVGNSKMVIYRAKQLDTITNGVTDADIEDAILVDYGDPNNIQTTDMGLGTVARGTVVADFDGDGIDDYYAHSHGHEFGDGEHHATEGNNIIYLSTLQYQGKVIAGGYTHGACSGDFNGDTFIDMIDVNSYSGSPIVRYNDGNGNFTAHDTPIELREPIQENFTSCVAIDTNSDSIDDVVLGRNADYNLEVNGHTVLLGGTDGLTYGYETEVIPYDHAVPDGATGAIKMFNVSNRYVIAYVTDYITSWADLLEVTDNGLVLVDNITLTVDATGTHDAEMIGNEMVPLSANTSTLNSYYTEEVSHVSIVNGKLVETVKTR
ncbi:hypothetical protein AEA42_07605 [Shewanella sp. Sh95]|uniref:hypothetical protein n=1 Tax=Shewanella sp. Sh95 TaxID=1689868 RepID=UPI0006D9745F|nr:hypothetical protein [Shewanella sp. Sh95]KPN77588.1 hypothetical protein AEA42_07605 [Shewanella sp. Sh95]